MISYFTIGSLADKIFDKLLFYKYFTLLNNKSMRSIKGNTPVPPQIIITFPEPGS